MPNYKEMYLTMARATEHAINILIKAQRESEEIYISEPSPEISLVLPNDDEEADEEKQ